MSPTPFNVPLNAKIVAKHGTTSVYALKDGRLSFVDHATNRTFVDGSRDVGSGTYGAGHNSAWADSRINAVAAKGGSRAFANTKALRPKQSSKPANYAPEEEEVPDEPFARFMPMIPKAFLDWADSYRPGDPLPPMMPGYGDAILCDKSITDDSYSQDSFGVDQVVETTLKAMGLPDINPALAFAPEPGTKSLTQLETKGILGREIRDMARNIADSILSARGLWRDELNKIRCGSGPNANRFTDIFGTGCDVPGADMAGNLVGAVRAGADLPGPVDEVAGKLEGARESFADAADGFDVPGSKPGLGAQLKGRLAGTRGGHTPHYEGDSPISGVDPAAGMAPTTTARPSKRWNWMGVRSLVSRNKQRERDKQMKKRAEDAKRKYSAYLSSDEYRRWEADFVRTNGRMPHAGEKLDQFARHLGWTGTIKDAAGNPVIDDYGRPVGSFMGMADTAAVDGRIYPDMTHFEAVVEQIVRDPRNNEISFDYLSPRQQENRRKEVSDNIEEYALLTLDAMMNAGGPKQIEVVRPDGTRALVDNPEHKKRFAEVMPTYLRVKHPRDSMNRNPGLVDAAVVTSVNTFVPDAESFVGQPLRPGEIPAPMTALNLNTAMNGATPAWVTESLDNPPFMATITLDPVWFSSKRNQTEKLAAFSDQHLGMAVSRESFLYHTADHELNHVDDFATRLGQKLGYVGDAPGVGAGTSEWMDRLSQQSFDNTAKRWSNTIDLMRDTAPWTFLGQQVAQLQTLLSDRTTSEYERRKALWNFYMNNLHFDSRVESAYARWLAFDVPSTPGGARLSKAEQATLLQEIRDNLIARGYGEETGVPSLNFWQDMLDTPTGTWNPATKTFEFPYDPSTRRLDTAPRNIMDLPRPGALPYGQARLDNAVSNLLHGFIGGTYAGENDFEFAAELRTQLNKPGALGEIREFLADKDRNIHGLDESHFMTLVAKYVGQDEVYRLYGERPPARGTPPGAGGGAPGGRPPGGGGGGALRPAIPLGPGPTPTPPTPPGGGGGATPPRTPPGGGVPRPTIPMVPRADDPRSPTRPFRPGEDTGAVTKIDDIPDMSDDAIEKELEFLENKIRPIDGNVTAARMDGERKEALRAELRRRRRGGRRTSDARPRRDDDLAEPTVRPETEADRVSPERRRADAERERRVRELFGDEEVNPAEEATSSDRPRTTASAARDELNAARERVRDRRFAEREEADKRAEEASRRMAENRAAETDNLRLNRIREERVNATARVAEAETRHDDALRRARRTGSDPDRGGDGDPAAWADYRAAYEELNDADAENARLLRESRELEDRIPKSETPTPVTTRDPSRRSYERPETPEGIIVEGETPRRQIRMINATTGEIIYVDSSNARAMEEVRAEGFAPDVRQPTAPARRPANGRGKPRTKPAGEPDWVRRERARRDRMGLPDDIPGYDDEPDVGMAPPTRASRWSVGVGKSRDDAQRRTDDLVDYLANGDGAYQTSEWSRSQARAARNEAYKQRQRRDNLIRNLEGIRNGTIDLPANRRERSIEDLQIELADAEAKILQHEMAARLLDQHAANIDDRVRRDSLRTQIDSDLRLDNLDPVSSRTFGDVDGILGIDDGMLMEGALDPSAGMASGDRSGSLGRIARGSMRDRAMAKLLDRILDRTGADEETREKVKIGVGLATAFSAGGPAGAATYVAVEAARRGGRDLAEFTVGELLKRGKIDDEQARRAMAAVDRIAPDGLPDDAKRRLAVAFSEAADLFNERINTPENRRRLAEMGENVVDSTRQRARDIGERVRRRRSSDSPFGDGPDAGMASGVDEEIFLQPDGTFGIRPGMEGIPEVRARRGDGTNARQARGPRSAFGEDVSAGMGRTYDRFLDVHSGVVDQKRDEIAETKRILSPSARKDPTSVTREEAQNIAATVERLFSGEMRIERNIEGSFVTEMVSNGRAKIAVRPFVNPDLVSVGPDGNLRIPVSMQITSPDGKSNYGNALRYIEVGNDGINVEHGSITINDAYRGFGIASEFNARNENLYKAIGASSITTSGSSSSSPDSDNPIMPDIILGTGATHWARNGFTWRDDEAKNRFISVIDGALTNKPGIFTEEERNRIGSLYRKKKDGTFETEATPEDLVDFAEADRLFAEEGVTIPYRRDLEPQSSDQPSASRLTRIADRLGRRRSRNDVSEPSTQEWNPQADMDATRSARAGGTTTTETVPDWIRNWDPEGEISSGRGGRGGGDVFDEGPEAGMSGGNANRPAVRTDGEGRPLTSTAAPQRSGTATANYEANVRGIEDDSRLVKSEIDALEAAIAQAEATGEWRGADFGVSFEDVEPQAMPDRAYLTRTAGGITNPRNLSAEETKQNDAISRAKRRLATAKKEQVRLARVATDKRTRREQNVLDLEDIPAEELEQLVAEAEDIKRAVAQRNEARDKLRSDPRFADLDWEQRQIAIDAELDRMGMPDPLSPGEGQRAAMHVGTDTLENGVLDPSFTAGDETMATGGGNTGSLNQTQIRNVMRQREDTASKLKAAERIVQELESGTTTITPRDKTEADLLNGLTYSTKFSAGQSLDLSTVNSRVDATTLSGRIVELLRASIDRDSASLTKQDAILKRISESPKFGYVSAYPLRPEGTVTEGYFGRNSGKKVPANIGTFLTEVEQNDRNKRTPDGFVDVKDRPMLERWMRTIRGTQWLVIGGDDTVVRGFGNSPGDEAQVIGINKPVFGFSFGKASAGNYRTVLGDIGMALAARAVSLRRSGEEVTPESVMQARRKVETSRIIMLARGGATIEEIAQQTGRSRQFVSELLNLSGVTNANTGEGYLI